MPRTYTSKYSDFSESVAISRRGKLPPHDITDYVDIMCPHCNEVCAELPITLIKTQKATHCLKHLRVCEAFKAKGGEVPMAKSAESVPKKRKQTHDDKHVPANIVTIHKIIYKPETRVVYTGQTKAKLEDRLKRHAARKSGCRLVRNAIRRHGMRKFAIEPIVHCHPDDADANESYYIIANNTLHPNGYNLRHGSKAGDDSTDSMQVVPLAPKGSSCEDDPRACSDAMMDVAGMCDDPEESGDEDAEAMSLALLQEVHPEPGLKALCD